MKRLFFVRHAKAEKEAVGHKDFDRELHPKGVIDAPRMGRVIAENAERPQKLIASPAARTHQTAKFFAEQLQFETTDIEFNSDIYQASIRTLLNVVNGLDDTYDCIMLFGHNPAFSHLPEYLTKEIIGDIPPCGVVLVHFDVDSWSLVSANTGSIKGIWYPEAIS